MLEGPFGAMCRCGMNRGDQGLLISVKDDPGLRIDSVENLMKRCVVDGGRLKMVVFVATCYGFGFGLSLIRDTTLFRWLRYLNCF